jgi:hypothetical protein
MLMASTRFGVSAGLSTSFRVISRSQTECLHSSQGILRRGRFSAALTNTAWRSALFVAIGRLHARERSERLEMGSGCRCRGYRFGCRSVPIQLSVWATRASRLCGHVSLWIHYVFCGEPVAVAQGRRESCVAFPSAPSRLPRSAAAPGIPIRRINRRRVGM